MKKSLEFVLVFVIFLIALCTRLYAIREVEPMMQYDALNYHNMAKNFIENGFLGYSTDGFAKKPNAYITPGYPLFLSGVYTVFGENESEDIEAVKIIQAILSAVTVVFVYFIGKKIGNRCVGIFSSVLMIGYPTFLVVSAFHLTETLYTFLFIVYLYFQIIVFETDKKWLHMFVGAIFGLSVLVRPLIFPFFILIYLYRRVIERDRKALRQMCFFAIGLMIVLVPWWVRNYIVLKKVILLSSGGGNPLLGGAYPPQFAPKSYSQNNQLQEGIRVIVNGLKEQPREYLHWFTIGKLKIMFEQMYLSIFLPGMEWFLNIHFGVIAFGTIGCLCAFVNKNIRIIVLYVLMLVGSQLLFIPESRYAFSIMPLFMILTSYVALKKKTVFKQ